MLVCCNHCDTTVLPNSDGTCPSCRHPIDRNTVEEAPISLQNHETYVDVATWGARLKDEEPEFIDASVKDRKRHLVASFPAILPKFAMVFAILAVLTIGISCNSEFDAVDNTLFETLQWIADKEQSFSLWDEPANGREYKVTEMPVYFIRRDANDAPVKAYLINFPSPPAGAVEVSHSFAGLGTIHRYDGEMSELHPAATFDFELDLSGRLTYAMSYKPSNMDRDPLTNTSIPYTRLDVWVNNLIHELFHHYQFHAPDSDWLSLAWGGLSTDDYPVTADNLALTLLERHALVAGKNAATIADKAKVLRRILAIRHTRMELHEAADNCQIFQLSKDHGQQNNAPNGVGQSFTACQTGVIKSIRVNVIALNNPNSRLELQTGTSGWHASYSQNVVLAPGENVIPLAVPFPVDAEVVYAFGLFPSVGPLSLWSDEDLLPGGEAFFITGSTNVGISPTPDLTFELTVEGPNYIDLMDRYQERNEGSATYVSRRFVVLSGNTVYAQEMLEMLERGMRTDTQTSRDQFMSTTFQGGWYNTGSTILDLVDVVTNLDWKSTFPDGGSPIEVLETLYGPLTQQEIDQLVDDAKQAYNWQAILQQAATIPPGYLDPSP